MPSTNVYPNLNQSSSLEDLDLEKTKLITIDSQKTEVTELEKNKRKFVCIEFDARASKIIAKKYDNNEFIKARESGREIYLGFFVKANEQDSCYKEAKSILKKSVNLGYLNNAALDNFKLNTIVKLIDHFKTIWKNYNDMYKDYLELQQAYDGITGENVTEKLSKFKTTYDGLHNIYIENEEIYGTDRASGLKLILDKMKTAYLKAVDDHQHLKHNSFVPLGKDFNSIEAEFNSKLTGLEAEDKANLLKDKYAKLEASLILLKTKCKSTCADDSLYSKKIIDEHAKITQDIEGLLGVVNSAENKQLIEQEMQGLQVKYENLDKRLTSLDVEIEELQQVAKFQVANKLIEDNEKLLADIKDYPAKSNKRSIQKILIEKANTIIGKVNDNNPVTDIKEAIEEAISFINENGKAANVPTGFFGGPSKFGELVSQLKEFLVKLSEIFLANFDKEINEDCSASIRPNI